MPVSAVPASVGIVHLQADDVSVVIDCRGDDLPRVVHWGARVPDDPGSLVRLADAAAQVARSSDDVDTPSLPSLVPLNSRGWIGTPGISGHRAGRDFSPRLLLEEAVQTGERLEVTAIDPDARLRLDLTIELLPDGLLRSRGEITNLGDGVYDLGSLLVLFPVPGNAVELLDFTGRHLRERIPQRHDWAAGSHRRDSRRGRTGSDATLLMVAGEQGFGFRSGEVWGVQTAWSGNHTTLAERGMGPHRLLGGGELLLPGEIRLDRDETYRGPWIYGSWGRGLDELSARFHAHLRSTMAHAGTPRPVVLNTWEAVYFDHDLDALSELAELAFAVGVERFVLDDGWFVGRRDDTAGLGDWTVDESVWPDGLSPIVDRVRERGMQFGLWFEPEMINEDSDVARAHPDWIMGPGSRLPLTARQQQVIDLANPAAYAHVLDSMTALIERYAIDYVKWDHNRDLIEAGHPSAATAGVHDQTRAVYRLIDELRARFPDLEIESCASGGGRADLEILSRTDRIWASDCIDALERQEIQRWTGLTVPPEMIGSHVGSAPAHTTGRRHSLDFRAGTALFGHFGIEWDLRTASGEELDQLEEWITAYKCFRDLLHSGRVIRADVADPAYWLHGVVSPDGDEALFAFVGMATSTAVPPGRIRLPGLDDDRVYRVRAVGPTATAVGPRPSSPTDWWNAGTTLEGSILSRVGIPAPRVLPEQLVLAHLTTAEER